MYADFVKLAQDSLKPMLNLAENNTALVVKLLNSQAQKTSELLEGNLAHVQALVETKDANVALELNQKYVESLNQKWLETAKENAGVVESAVGEATKVLEGSIADIQAQAKKTVENIEKGLNKAGKKAA